MTGQSKWRMAVSKTRFAAAWAMTLVGALSAAPFAAQAADAPGVSATEIKVGATFPMSGPASALGAIGKSLAAYVDSINERGGINGRKINMMIADDGYAPPKTVEMTRRMVESDEVAFIFGPLGTPGIAATIKYLNDRKVPQLFVTSGATSFTKFQEFPYTTTALVSYETEGLIYAKYIDTTLPNAKIGILYQNDDLGKDYVAAFKTYFKGDFDKRVVTISYETTDPTVDSQIISLKNAGVDAVLMATTPKAGSQAVRKIASLQWKPLRILNVPSSSVAAVIMPAGPENAVGVVSANLFKDTSEKVWDNDPGMKEYRAFFAKHLSGADILNNFYLYGYNQGRILEQLLKQCGNDLSRENIIRQARSIKGFALPTFLPGITINTGPDSNMAYTQLQLQRWNGTAWDRFGEIQSSK